MIGLFVDSCPADSRALTLPLSRRAGEGDICMDGQDR